MPSRPLLKPAPRARSPTLLGITMNSTLGTENDVKAFSFLNTPSDFLTVAGSPSAARNRYRRTTSEEELARLHHIPIPSQTDLPISYNIAPSRTTDDPRARHRRELAEPPPKPKKLSHREQRTAWC
jgi:hypothetical protein